MINLVCLPLHQIDVILGMNWLEFNGVSINCYNKTVDYSYKHFTYSNQLCLSICMLPSKMDIKHTEGVSNLIKT